LVFELIQFGYSAEVVVDVDGSPISDEDITTHQMDLKIPYQMEHSLSTDGKFTPRSIIDVVPGRRKSVSFAKDLVLSGIEKTQFEELLLKDGLYRIRIKPLTNKDDDDEGKVNHQWIMASIPICELVKSGFKEEIKLLFETSSNSISSIASINGGGGGDGDIESLKLLSLDYRVQTSRFTKAKDCHAPLPAEIHFSTAATFTTAIPAQALAVQPMDGAAATGAPPPGVPPQLVRKNDMNNKGGPGGGGGNGGDAAQGQSFIRKYWYIILPMMVLMMSGPAPPDEGKGGGGSGGGRAPAPSS
jgi:hypothetical protein